jgi:hypothetical protein
MDRVKISLLYTISHYNSIVNSRITQNLFQKGVYFTQMVQVTQKEAERIRKLKPDITISKTMKQYSSRGKRYCPEYREIIEWLKKERGVDHID